MTDFFSKCDQIRQKTAEMQKLQKTEEILNGKLHFLCSESNNKNFYKC